MNIPQERIAKFKQELGSILFLSAIQIWLSVNFPAFVRLGPPLSTIVSLSISVSTIIAYIFVFSYADTYAPRFNLEYLDDAPGPYGHILKNLHRIGLITLAFTNMLYFWYTDYYGMSNILYAVMYGHWIITFMLMARAINRRAPGFEHK